MLATPSGTCAENPAVACVVDSRTQFHRRLGITSREAARRSSPNSLSPVDDTFIYKLVVTVNADCGKWSGQLVEPVN